MPAAVNPQPVASLQIPHQRMGFSGDTKMKGDRLLAVGFKPLFLECVTSPIWPTGLSFHTFHVSKWDN